MNAKSIWWEADGEFVNENKSDEFDFYRCHNKLPQSEWLKTTQIYYLTNRWVIIRALCGSAAPLAWFLQVSTQSAKLYIWRLWRWIPTDPFLNSLASCQLQNWSPLTYRLLAFRYCMHCFGDIFLSLYSEKSCVVSSWIQQSPTPPSSILFSLLPG